MQRSELFCFRIRDNTIVVSLYVRQEFSFYGERVQRERLEYTETDATSLSNCITRRNEEFNACYHIGDILHILIA